MSADSLRLTGTWRITMRDAATGLLRSEREYRNIATVNGKTFLAQFLNLEAPPHTATNIYGAVGTSNFPPDATQTNLAAELARVVLATTSRSANVVTMDFFFNTSQGSGAWAEAGLFLGASGTANSGQMLSRVLVSETKTSSITATLEWSVQIG